MKKRILIVLAMVLVCAVSVMGTLAYLTARSQTVTNTFTAAGGIIIDDRFKLDESKASLSKGTYTLDGNNRVQGNDYSKVVPGMTIPKDPTLSIDIEDGVEAYVFVEVVDTTAGNLSYEISSDWTLLTGVTGNNGGKVYVYKNTVTGAGTDGADWDLNGVKILKDDKVTAATRLTDTDTSATGTQLGKLVFYGYACQAVGFSAPAAAYTACFPAN